MDGTGGRRAQPRRGGSASRGSASSSTSLAAMSRWLVGSSSSSKLEGSRSMRHSATRACARASRACVTDMSRTCRGHVASRLRRSAAAAVAVARRRGAAAFSPPERRESLSSTFSPLNMNLPSSARSSSYLRVEAVPGLCRGRVGAVWRDGSRGDVRAHVWSVDAEASCTVCSTVLSRGRALAWSCSK